MGGLGSGETPTIACSLPVETHVKLSVCNSVGQELTTLVDQVEAPGNHSAVWNASGLPSGIHFYRITAGSFTETRRMAILK